MKEMFKQKSTVVVLCAALLFLGFYLAGGFHKWLPDGLGWFFGLVVLLVVGNDLGLWAAMTMKVEKKEVDSAMEAMEKRMSVLEKDNVDKDRRIWDLETRLQVAENITSMTNRLLQDCLEERRNSRA